MCQACASVTPRFRVPDSLAVWHGERRNERGAIERIDALRHCQAIRTVTARLNRYRLDRRTVGWLACSSVAGVSAGCTATITPAVADPTASTHGGLIATRPTVAGTPKWEGTIGRKGKALGQFDTPIAVAVDVDGTVYVADAGNDRIVAISPTGVASSVRGHTGNRVGELSFPSAVTVGADGVTFVSDAGNNRIQTFGPSRNTELSIIGSTVRLAAPRGLAISPSGHLLVADSRHHQIIRVTFDGQPASAFGRRGTARGEFDTPKGIAIAPNGMIVIADAANHRIQCIAPDGRPIWSTGYRGVGPGDFLNPEGIVVADDGTIWVADTGNDRIQGFTPDGTPKWTWGRRGRHDGELDSPTGLAADGAGALVIADANNHRILRVARSAFVTVP